jgi:hypothetical protein
MGFWAPPSGAKFQLRFDIGPEGVERLVFANAGNGNDYEDRVVLNITGPIAPGTYVLAKQMSGNIVENHFGFGFTGDPANHGNIVKSESLGGYVFTLDTADDAGGAAGYMGNYNEYKLTVARGGKR